MKRTLLNMTQNILSALSSDEVNSISDTTESLQVAEIIRTTYFNIISRVPLSEHEQPIQLDPSLDSSIPVLMHIPEGIGDLKWLKYFNSNINASATTSTHGINVDISPSFPTPSSAPGYEYVTILPITQFIDMINSFNPLDTNVDSFTFSDSVSGFPGSYVFYYKDNKQPQYCTIINNYYVVFDSFDETVDSTLQATKTFGLGSVIPIFKMEDTFIPNMAEEQFPLLLNEAKSIAFFEMKQSPHPKAEQEAKRGWGSIQKDKAIINKPSYFDQLANFGRRGYGGTRYFKQVGLDR